ncbi:hypothetical protein FP2506_07696 [Fulvimarina pelagi HTCC2506]|uniref:SH3b domain-containing protein n=1 Tax=Fulvimarina pelagi HTCC2506 TaxID=314231 RepID=Q0G6K7_9HYPH|nr:SH3 domain-containing protein [Fulvimarina pelagi]EAU42707.1 hypothetical protein FP2506_07696 [Fulvimarina pelagi HTCC2506]
MQSLPLACLLATTVGIPFASAQQIVVPSNRTTEVETGCLVRGLDPNGDGFLALRSGPGTGYPQIGSLRNGDAAYIKAPPKERWLYVENGAINGRETTFRGWIYDAWCEFYP